MFNFVLLLISSIIVARFLEKRYRIASLFHAVLFLFLALVYMFSSDSAFFVTVCKNMVGNTYYASLHEVLTQHMTTISASFSVYMIVEYVTLLIVGMVSIVATVKALKKLASKIKIDQLSDVKTEQPFIFKTVCNCDREISYRKTYLELGHLLN